MYKYCFITFALIIQTIFISAQTNYPPTIHKYNMQDGLSNDIVYDICQDDDGCIWFATAEGISKFNSSDFSSFYWYHVKTKLGNHQALKVIYLQNKIYSATPFGLIVYDMETDHFKIVMPEGINSMIVKALAKSQDGNIWVASYSGQGVYKFNIKDESFTPLKYEYTDSRIISLYEGTEGLLYIGTHFGGLDIVDLNKNKTVNYNELNTGIPGKQVEEILEDSFGNIWLGIWKGIALYDKKTHQIKRIENDILNNSEINALTEDQDGNLWVGTETGLFSFNIREALVNPSNFKVNLYNETQDEYGLSYRTVLDIHCDFENNIWIATNSGGVNLIPHSQPKFNRIIYDKRLENSLSYRRVTSVSEDRIGNLWITTDGGGINYFDTKRQQNTIYNTQNSNLKDDAVLCSLIDTDEEVWFGTYYHTLNRKIAGQNKFIIYEGSETKENSILEGDVFCLEEDAYKRIWIGQRSGLVYFDKKENQFTQIPQLKWITTRCLFATKNGIYIGTQPGVCFYDFVTKEIKNLHPVLEHLFVNCLYVDKNENLWIGTNGQGLYHYDIKSDSIDNYVIQSGLPSDNVCKILEDSENNLWLTTTKGISKISKGGKQIQNFTDKDGVQSGMFIENSGIKTHSGKLFFGGTEGVTFFNPVEITEDLQQSNIILTNFQLFNNTVPVRSEEFPDSPLEKTINYVKEISLKYDESVFSIEYASVDYRSTNQINYAYILEGVDDEWNYVKNKKTATYRYLPPGTYTFKVMASNLNGAFDTSKYKSLLIRIEPPFYLTWWAYIIYTLLLALVSYFIWNFITVKTRALSRIRYERLARQKSEELHQEKLLFFTNISHELKTPLTLIAAPVDRLLNEETSSEKKYLLSLIKRNVVRLLNNINQIMDIRKIDRNQMKLRVKELEVISFVGEIVDLFKDMAQSQNIDLEYSHQDENIRGWVSPEFLDKILCNLLSNALKFTPDHGEVIVDVFLMSKKNLKENQLCIEITDTGKGIPPQNLPYIFERFYQVESNKPEFVGMGSGVGLHLVKSLVELHKGNITVKSKIDVGTKFILTIPYTADCYTAEERNNSDYVYYHEEQLSAIAVKPECTQKVTSATILQGSKLLIIDDDPEILNFLKYELSSDYEVVTAENGRIGLEKAYDVIPDLIISDVMMPGIDGISVCKELKSNINTSHIPIILLTAKSSVDDRIEGLEVGADSYIPKPFDIRHLRVRVKKLIELRENIRNNYAKQLENKIEEKPKGLSAIDEELLQKIIAYVNANISNPDVNGESIAKHVAMSRMSLHRKLKALTGLSAGDFIRNIRLEKGKNLLEAGGKTVSEVSYEVGYSSPSYFYTCFVRKYGAPPSDFIRKE